MSNVSPKSEAHGGRWRACDPPATLSRRKSRQPLRQTRVRERHQGRSTTTSVGPNCQPGRELRTPRLPNCAAGGAARPGPSTS